jgi:hypothetical protein
MRATYVTRRGPWVPCGIASATPDGRRLRTLRWSVAGTWLAVGIAIDFLTQCFILDARGTEPRFQGLHEANHAAGLALIAVALAWFITLVPILPVTTRIDALARARIALGMTGALWIVWTLLRPHL